MPANPDYRDLFSIFSEERVDYLTKEAVGRPQDQLDLERLREED
jgi:hypothetical protein